MLESLDPDRLEPHPKNEEIYGDSLDQSFVDRVEEHGIQSKVKVTTDSHFTDGDWTIIGGHRRVAAAEELGLNVDVQEVGPFDTPEEELEALLIDNDHRDPAPAQEFREVEQWIEVYRESPKLETDTAVEEACKHVSFSTSTYYNAQRVKQAAEDGEWGQSNEPLQSETVDVANQQWDLLEQGETTIGAAYQEVQNYREKTFIKPSKDAHGGFGGESVKEKIEKEANYPVQASFEMDANQLKRILNEVKFPNSLLEESPQVVNIGVTNQQVDIWTSGVGDLRSHYTILSNLLESVSLENDGPYVFTVVLNEVLGYLDILSDNSVKIQLRGESEQRAAECLYSTGASEDSPLSRSRSSNLYFYLDTLRDDDDIPEAPAWLPSAYSK